MVSLFQIKEWLEMFVFIQGVVVGVLLTVGSILFALFHAKRTLEPNPKQPTEHKMTRSLFDIDPQSRDGWLNHLIHFLYREFQHSGKISLVAPWPIAPGFSKFFWSGSVQDIHFLAWSSPRFLDVLRSWTGPILPLDFSNFFALSTTPKNLVLDRPALISGSLSRTVWKN